MTIDMIRDDQEQQKVRMKKEILMKVHILFIKVENQLLMLSKMIYFRLRKHRQKDALQNRIGGSTC